MLVRYRVTDIKYDGENNPEFVDACKDDDPWPRSTTVIVDEDEDADPIEEQVREEVFDQFDFGCAIINFKFERDPDQTGVPN